MNRFVLLAAVACATASPVRAEPPVRFNRDVRPILSDNCYLWGSTDELGYKYLGDGQDMDVHDLHATMLHLCGIDHKRLTYRYQGRDFRLTDVFGRVVDGILA
jgi:Protein of unknown function (DUF1501)